MIINGDCLEELKKLKENSVDSVVTDPPYELGFMGKSWDSTGIANNKDMWKEVLRVLKPGGHLLSFGGTRTYHRMACAIEDAGFEIRDQIQWIYGSGFPKSHNIGKAVDKLEGNEREVTGTNRAGKNALGQDSGWNKHANKTEFDNTKGNSKWEGWGTALKPANEPIVLARKPLSEKTIAKNVLRWGTGGINIDESKIKYVSDYEKKQQSDIARGQDNATHGKFFGGKGKSKASSHTPTGRFPANLIHDGSDEVVSRFPNTKSGSHKAGQPRNAISKTSYVMPNLTTYTDSGSEGSASRFFYSAKASKSERNAGLEGFEEKGRFQQGNYSQSPFCKVCEKSFNGTNDHLKCGEDTMYYKSKVKNTVVKNNHPTVKPVKLMRYLVKLITPPNGTVLDPFMGSGTTGVACDGFKFIGIEMDKEYCKIAKARINQDKQLNL